MAFCFVLYNFLNCKELKLEFSSKALANSCTGYTADGISAKIQANMERGKARGERRYGRSYRMKKGPLNLK